MMTVYADDEEYGYLLKDILGDSFTDALMIFPQIGISADMIVIVESYNAEDAFELLTNYKLDRQSAYEGYAPFEAEKIANGFVDYAGNYAILVVLPDPDLAESLWLQAISQG